MATGSKSKSIKPISTNWRSVQIRWSLPGADDLLAETIVPYVELEKVKGLDTSSILTEFRSHLDPSQIEDYRKRPLLESIPLPRLIPSGSDHATTETVERARARQETYRMEMRNPSLALVGTKVTVWITVDVELLDNPSLPPPIHVWAFLQPSNFDKSHKALSGDDSFSKVDFPRSGWGEYLIDPTTKSAKRRLWKGTKTRGNTVGTKTSFDQFEGSSVPLGDWSVRQIPIAGTGAASCFRYKLKIEILDERTAGDVRRAKSKESGTLPDKDYEAGSWLKVWVRDPLAGWNRMPEDDESQSVAASMDDQDPPSEDGMTPSERADLDRRTRALFGLPANTPSPVAIARSARTLGAHGFRRERICLGDPKASPDLARPVYALLMNAESAGYLVELQRILSKKAPNELQQAGSMVAVSMAAGLLSYYLHKGLENWNHSIRDKPAPAGTPADISWPGVAYDRHAQTLRSLLESLDLSNLLAAYAVTGFQFLSPVDAVDAADRSSSLAYGSFAKLYDLAFDMSLSEGLSKYKELFGSKGNRRDFARKQLSALREEVKTSNWMESKTHGQESKEASEKKWREEQRKRLGIHERWNLGLGDVKTKASWGTDNILLKFPLVEGEKEPLMIPRGGIPLEPFGLPLVFFLQVAAGGSIEAFLNCNPPSEEGGDWTFVTGFEGKGNLSITAHISSPTLGAAAPEKDGDEKKKVADQSLVDAAADAGSGTAKGKEFPLLDLIHKLNEVCSAEAWVGLAFNLEALLGFSFKWNAKDGLKDFTLNIPGGGDTGYDVTEGHDSSRWDSPSARAFKAGLKASVEAGIRISLAHTTYPLLEVPKLAEATPVGAALNLGGRVCGEDYPGKEIKLAKWGKGKLDRRIVPASDDTIFWGTDWPFTLKFFDLSDPLVGFDLVRAFGTTPSDESPESIGEGAVKSKVEDAGKEAKKFEGPNNAHAVSVIPQKALKRVQQGTGGKFTGVLRLTSARKTQAGDGVVVGDWETQMKGSLGDKGTFDLPTAANFLKTQSGKFLSELVEKGSAQVQIRANYLGSIFSFSEPISIPCPSIQAQECLIFTDLLQISLKISDFEDKCLWVSLWQISRKQKVALKGSTEWFFADVTKTQEDGFNAQILLPLGGSGLHDAKDFFPYISLVPDPLGILNRGSGPKDGPYPRMGDGGTSSTASDLSLKARGAVSDQLKGPSLPHF